MFLSPKRLLQSRLFSPSLHAAWLPELTIRLFPSKEITECWNEQVSLAVQFLLTLLLPASDTEPGSVPPPWSNTRNLEKRPFSQMLKTGSLG